MWTSEPKGKLDVMAAMTRSAGQPVGGVVGITNGPQDVDVDWLSINWRQVTDDVRRLRQRIFAATQAGDLKKGPQPAHARGYPTHHRGGQPIRDRHPGRTLHPVRHAAPPADRSHRRGRPRCLTKTVLTLPAHLRRSLTWDQGKEMSQHRLFTIATVLPTCGFTPPTTSWPPLCSSIAGPGKRLIGIRRHNAWICS